MEKTKSRYHSHRFSVGVISQMMRRYFRFQLSPRDIEELLFERGVIVSYKTIVSTAASRGFGENCSRRFMSAMYI